MDHLQKQNHLTSTLANDTIQAVNQALGDDLARVVEELEMVQRQEGSCLQVQLGV